MALGRARRWLFLTGARWQVAVLFFGAVVAAFLAVSDGTAAANRAPLYYLFGSLIAGNITLITVVVSINQLVLSRDFGSPRELQTEIRETIAFHQAATGESAVPLDPAEFLRESVRQLGTDADALPLDQLDDPERATAVRTLRDRLTRHAVIVIERLAASDDRLLAVVSSVLSVRYLESIHEIRSLRASADDDLPPTVDRALARLAVELEYLDIARYYFISMVLQQELSRLSRVLVYAGLPAIVLAAGTLVHLAQLEPDAALSFGSTVLVAGALLSGIVPIVLLGSYVLRISTIARYVSITPFDAP
nr:hypothetical protein [Natronococcus occultus]